MKINGLKTIDLSENRVKQAEIISRYFIFQVIKEILTKIKLINLELKIIK